MQIKFSNQQIHSRQNTRSLYSLVLSRVPKIFWEEYELRLEDWKPHVII